VPGISDYLFDEVNITTVLENQRNKLKDRVEQIPEHAAERKRA
jgi:hypothetical protein